MSRRVVALLGLLGVLAAAGWVLAAQLDRLETTAQAAAVLTALVLGLATVAVAADRRAPGGWLGVQTALVACVTVASLYRLFPSGWVAAAGALVWFSGALVLPELLVRYPDDHDPRVRSVTRWACRVVPPVLGVALVLTSGPRVAGDSAVRALTWSEGGSEPSRLWQVNPMGGLASPAAVRALTLAWAVWALGVVAWVGRRLVVRWQRADVATMRTERAVAVAGSVALLGTVVQVLAAVPVGEPRDPAAVLSLDRWYGTLLFAGGVLTLPGLVAVLAWFEVVRPRLARTAGGALELGPVVADAGDALARLLDDPTVGVQYRSGGSWVDHAGVPVGDPADAAVLVVERAGVPVARIHHDEALRDRPEELEAAAQLVGLLLDNSQLRADTMARAEEVRASGARLLSAAEQARTDVDERIRRGPVALLDRGQAVLQRPEVDALALEEVASILRSALAEVRTISHGLTPPVLDEEGLAGALVVLADTACRPLEVRRVPTDRLPGPIETTAYLVVREALATVPGELPVALDLTVCGDQLVVQVEGASVPLTAQLADRVETLGGWAEQDGQRLVVRLPLAGGSGDGR